MPIKKTKKSLSAEASQEIKSKFNLSIFKGKKGLDSNIKFKEQRWIKFSKALQETLSIPGCSMGHIVTVRGKSNTGKSTMAIELAVEAQKMGVLPIIIMTEMKHNWDFWKKLGFDITDIKDDNGDVISHEGFFIYRDRSTLNSIEDIAKFIIDMLKEQKDGNLPYDLFFLWDSVGSIPCDMSIEKGSNNPMWNAGAIATQFGNFINQKIILSRKEDQPYTNTLFIVNKTGVAPAVGPLARPKMTNKGGDTFWFDSSLMFTFGNITNSGTSKISATKNGKKVEYALRTKIVCDKNHINGVTTAGVIISTAYGFINNTDKDIKKYKKEHSSEWIDILGEGRYETEEDDSEWEEGKNIENLTEIVDSL